ncbi:MAG: UDP-N-acetylglucosamine--N-acetylmuramyl-(pentapeptide) pyrophosphoryl-undecaprenol N-acetylglucosamine transferase [Patescibacteria group bacterium]
MKIRPIIFSGGGTLGSVMPLVSVIEQFKKRYSNEICWCGTYKGPERNVLRSLSIHYTPFLGGKFRRYISWKTFIDPLFIVMGFFQSVFFFLFKKPVAIVSAGSFISVPLLWVAWFFQIPTIALQLDVKLGLANRLVLPFLSQFGSLFPLPQHSVPIACPVRSAILALSSERDKMKKEALLRFSFATKPTILVLGGGIGAEPLNALVQESIHSLLLTFNVLHSTGTSISQKGKQLSGYRAQPFFGDDLIFAYAAADIIISRAGMGTITEAAALKAPLILIPLPHSPQEHNAVLLAKSGAAVVLHQNNLTSSMFINTLTKLLADQVSLNALGASLHRAIPVDDGSSVISLINNCSPKLITR